MFSALDGNGRFMGSGRIYHGATIKALPCSTFCSLCLAPAASFSWLATPRSATGSDVMLDLILGGAVSAGLFFYLVWALVRPEDF